MEKTSELLDTIQRDLYTAVICDSLDELGLRNQAMRPNLRPVYPKASMAGWARTISCCDLYHIPEDPYGKEIEAIDSLLPGEVAVVGTGESTRNAPWGELLSTAATARGSRGAVVDGLVRDVDKIEAIPFPVFAAGLKPVDSQGRGIVTDYNLPVECGGVLVSPGDLVVTDADGVIVVPETAIEDTIRRALERVNLENRTRDELRQGAYLRDVYEKYGVL